MTEQAEALTRLRGTRAVYLRHTNNLERSILDKIVTFSCENEDQISELQGLRSGFSEKPEKIKELDEKLLELLPQKDSESEIEVIVMRENSNFKIIAKIDRCLSEIPLAGILNSLSISNRTPSVSQDAKVKLPKLELSKLDGDIINWKGFWDQFQVAIHENETIAEID